MMGKDHRSVFQAQQSSAPDPLCREWQATATASLRGVQRSFLSGSRPSRIASVTHDQHEKGEEADTGDHTQHRAVKRSSGRQADERRD